MKVLIVMPCYRPATRFGGPIGSVHSLAVALRSLGHEVAVFATNSNGPCDLPVALGVAHDIDGVQVTYFPVRWPRSYFRSPSLKEALRARARGFDVGYLPWLYVYTTTAAASEFTRQGVPFVISPRGMLDRKMIEKKGRLRKTAYLSLVGSRHFRRAAAIHFTSPLERDLSWARFDEARTWVIPNGLDIVADLRPDRWPDPIAGLGRNRQVVLFLGRLSYIKGLDLLAAAWPLVARGAPLAHLVLAGPDDEHLYGPFQREIARAGAHASVSYVGLVDDDQKAALMRRCVLLVAPSHSDSFGMSVLEAMSQGKPVVVSRHVGISPEVEASGGGRVVASDAEELASAILEIIHRPDMAREMGASGKALVETRFSILAIARRMEAALESVAKRAS
ncbi:MAG: glycosyltransferase [Usitatibacter sp.]